MKKLILMLALVSTTISFANDRARIYENADGCRVQVSDYGPNFYQVTASKNVNGRVINIGMFLSNSEDVARMGGHCDESEAVASYDNGELIVSCSNGRAEIKTDLNHDLELSYFNFSGYHYSFLFKKDDSFSCEGLVLTESGIINEFGEFI